MKKLYAHIQPYKFRLMVFALLCGATLLSLVLFRVRTILSGSLRWNSWDLLFNPLERLTQFLYYATHPSVQSIRFIGIFSTFFIFFYITIYAFSLLLQEQAQQIPQEIS